MLQVAADDPVLRPLLEDLAREYDARYAPTNGVPSSAELTRYPPSVFTEAQGGAFLVVLEEGRPIAGGALMRTGDAAEVKRMWTRQDRRRQGLAGVVLAGLEQRARRMGYRRLVLSTGAAQPEAVALYLRHGWTAAFDPAVPQPPDAYLRFAKDLPPVP